MTGQLLEQLVDTHEVAALYLRAPGEPAIDGTLRERLALAEEIGRPGPPVSAAGRAAVQVRRGLGSIAGRPAWATDWAVPAFARRARELVTSWRPDVVQAELHVMGQYLPALSGLGSGRILVDHEPGAAASGDLEAWERGPRRVGRRLDGLAWRRYERRVLDATDAVVTFSKDDQRLLAARAPQARVLRIAPGVTLPPQPYDPVGSEPPTVLFIGTFVHPPNVEGAIRLATRIFPEVRARHAAAKLEVVGDAPPAAVRELSGQGIVVTGRVDDVRPYLDRAAVVAAPLRLGRGTRVKVLEALAAGKALVATPRALAGVDVVPGQHVLAATTDAEIRDALLALLDSPERRRRLAGAARAWALENLRWEDRAAEYESLYDSLAATHEGGRP